MVAPPPVAQGSARPAIEIDENGVDRAPIRAMLDLSPEERLLKVEDFVQSVALIRERNAERPIR